MLVEVSLRIWNHEALGIAGLCRASHFLRHALGYGLSTLFIFCYSLLCDVDNIWCIIYFQINRYAFSGGQDSIESHRIYGANLEVIFAALLLYIAREGAREETQIIRRIKIITIFPREGLNHNRCHTMPCVWHLFHLHAHRKCSKLNNWKKVFRFWQVLQCQFFWIVK